MEAAHKAELGAGAQGLPPRQARLDCVLTPGSYPVPMSDAFAAARPMPLMEPSPAAPAPADLEPSQTRRQLIRGLCEVCTWPASRISLHERDLAADLLIGLLPSCDLATRMRLATRLAPLVDAPKPLLRYLVRDHVDVAAPLLANGAGLDDSDLACAIREELPTHALAIAGRRSVSILVSEALVGLGLPEVTAVLLRNAGATLSIEAMDVALYQSRHAADLCALLAGRPELRASQGLTLFWWADSAARAQLLRRFAVERTILMSELGDVFLTAAAERSQDVEARLALLMVERRQRTRLDTKGERAELEAAVNRLAARGFDPVLIAEAAHQTSLRAVTALRIFKDIGGEPLAVWAKASGLRRAQFEALFAGMQGAAAAAPESGARRTQALAVFDQLSTAKAAGVLRVWNWTIGAAAEMDIGQGKKPSPRLQDELDL